MINTNRLVYPCVIVILVYLYWYTYTHTVCLPGNLRSLQLPSSFLSGRQLNSTTVLDTEEFRHVGKEIQMVDTGGKIMTWFHPEDSDTIVFLHMQKTGGSYFLKKLYTLDVGTPCQLRSKRRLMGKESTFCPRPGDSPYKDTWIFSTLTFGWVCGLHPTWTEYNGCVPTFMDRQFGARKRRYMYITILRHPVARFASEYLHARRGATWFYKHKCRNSVMSPDKVPPCYKGYYDGESWPDLTFEKFISCPYNQGFNRQTMMLADLTLIGCYRNMRSLTKSHKDTLLASAKLNLLRKFSSFAINEYLSESQILLEYQFGRKFLDLFEGKDNERMKSGDLVAYIFKNRELYDKVVELNQLDMELYKYALELFSSRLATLGVTLDVNKLQNEINESPIDEQSVQEQL
ncbi:heparan-sulfate 6-O-sulfotransferase 1-A-like [Dysidea avara]|uniref:heparan-sulfate 6-O-sulfotransferase 1-A-like n=1 Tax=Dysidea avara TaxID=196820 RepID=UPI003320E448